MSKYPADQLVKIMRQLRDKENGCPWDIEQNFDSIAPYTVEEAYEVADAICKKDIQGLKSELGDLLFQVVFHAQMADEQGLFDFNDVVLSICEKMTRRHPHVFGDKIINSIEEQNESWESIKQQENPHQKGMMTSLKSGLPALRQAEKTQKKAAKVGFDWQNPEQVFPVIMEEMEELIMAMKLNSSEGMEHEMGDVLFSCVNLSRHLGIDPDMALRKSNRRFIQRFEYMESQLENGAEDLKKISASELSSLWLEAKVVLSEE